MKGKEIMENKNQKDLRDLKIGGIYTTIAFGIIFVAATPLLNLLDPSGNLSLKMNSLSFYNPPTKAIGLALIFC